MIAELALVATWYAKGLPDPEALTAASRAFPRYSYVCLVHAGKHTGPVWINDWPESDTPGLVDLSRGAFRKLAPLSRGRIAVRVCDKNHLRGSR